MKLKSFNLYCLLIIFLFSTPLKSEDEIDIWKKNNTEEKQSTQINKKINKEETQKLNFDSIKTIELNQKIEITDGSLKENSQEAKVFGIYDPADNDFDLNMWSSTKAEDIKSSLKRLEKIKLSKTADEILERILMSFAYSPKGMKEDEFTDLKINWLIKNQRTDLIENFVKQNKEFKSKSRAVQYLVDKNIAQADINEGCEKIKFIDKEIKDAYLEKFKIYCLVFNGKKSEAQLLLDLLREQNQSDKFYDDKINFLLGVSNKTSKTINENNLLNFYLSSVTNEDFNFKPNKNTKKEIWQYLNASNLIKVEDISDKARLNELELAANKGQINKDIIFKIYQQVPYNLSELINAKSKYQNLQGIEARSLIYQKYLLSEDNESKMEYLFLLEELFKKENLQNIYSKFLSDKIQEIGIENISERYQEIAQSRIIRDDEFALGKVKYNDKILHQSKILKYYFENENEKKVQKDIDKIFKKISKNRKYFYSAKDLALIDSLINDGFSLPSNFDYKNLAEKFDIPKNLLKLIENNQNAFLALKIVEIIGEDEPNELDPETIYFITNLLNKMNLKQIRNLVFNSALPLRA
ncbi:hypothetical protein N9K36_01690 [Candidatus Pelagibacter bacterium]|nr:hypothetical protein [Candidatus Pelagibacter bacterium]